MNSATIDRLLRSDDPSVRYLTLTRVCMVDADSVEAQRAREEIRSSARVRTLLSRRGVDGRIPGHPYAKWTGAHWTLVALAELGYPPGDGSLLPLRDQVYAWLLSPDHTQEHISSSKASSYGKSGVPIMDGRARRCGSQEGNALWSTLTLGITDDRADVLAVNLFRWQWPDGGWNCDRRTEAHNSSFHETLLPLRALALHAKVTGSNESRMAAERASEVFLKRRLFRRIRDGEVIHPELVKLHYPCYWHYDVLAGLKVMTEAGFIGDPRCSDALDLLESRRLPDGGFPAEARYYRVSSEPSNGVSLVDWGGASKKQMNEFVTVDALYVLRTAGRL